MDQQFATKAILIMWLGAVGIVLYKEFNNPNNPGKPLPRPCKLIPPAIGYTGLGILAQFLPGIAALVALGLTVGEVVASDNPATNIFQQLSSSLNKQVTTIRQTP